ncbi:hypothetical protein [Ureibacillus acetophenoni]
MKLNKWLIRYYNMVYLLPENQTAEEDGYWVCVEVKEYEDIPSDMVTLTVPSLLLVLSLMRSVQLI